MANNDHVRFHIDVKAATAEGSNDFLLSFDFDTAGQDVGVRCNRDLSASDVQRLERLAIDFVGNIAAVIFKPQ